MAKGDWTSGTTVRLELVNIRFVPGTDTVDVVGIGYHVVLPSGQHATSRGFSWTPPTTHARSLQAAMTALVQAAIADEGVSGIAPST